MRKLLSNVWHMFGGVARVGVVVKHYYFCLGMDVFSRDGRQVQTFGLRAWLISQWCHATI